MVDIIKDLAVTLALAAICAVIAGVLQVRKRQIIATITDLVQKAEQAVEGSKMGEAKKAKVITQLEAMGITVTDKLSTLIDNIVAYLNEKSGWFVERVSTSAESMADSAIGKTKEDEEND